MPCQAREKNLFGGLESSCPRNHTAEAHLLRLWVILSSQQSRHKTSNNNGMNMYNIRPRELDTACFWGFFFLFFYQYLPSLLRNLLFPFLHRITRCHYPLFASASELLNTSQKCALKLQRNNGLWARKTHRSPRINILALLFLFCVMYTSVGEHSNYSRKAKNTELRHCTSLWTVGITESEDSDIWSPQMRVTVPEDEAVPWRRSHMSQRPVHFPKRQRSWYCCVLR